MLSPMTDSSKSEFTVPPISGISEKIQRMLDTYSENGFIVRAPEDILDRPIYGTTLYLATCKLDTVFGDFTAYVFQDIIHKGYIIALAHGKIKEAKTLYTRIHSSCITSETLRGCDCDCVEQLEGALKVIAEKGDGILFYLMQEGRGVGYIAKARDRMLVQAAEDEISTFQAYRLLGLRRDYRQYRNVVPICKMLKIDADFVLMTNNPDKVKAMKDLGFSIKGTQSIEYEPSPYNLAYLTSKQEAGHKLEKPDGSKWVEVKPPEPVIPFKPFALKNAQRFIKAASYMLPVRPVDEQIILSDKQFDKLFKNRPIEQFIEGANPIFHEYCLLRKHRYKIRLNRKSFDQFAKENPNDPIVEIGHQPYWFRVHIYFDIVTDEDFVVLTYGTPSETDVPMVRLQSESLFNRFPITETDNRQKYCQSIRAITDYGSGIILHLYSDGRGAGLGAYAQDVMFTQHGLSADTMDSYNRLGVSYDLRDYEAALILLKEHLNNKNVQMIMNSPSSLVKKTEYTQALNKLDLDVDTWIFLEGQYCDTC